MVDTLREFLRRFDFLVTPVTTAQAFGHDEFCPLCSPALRSWNG